MATVEARRRRRDGGSYAPVRYRVLYRDPSRRQRSRTFARKADADRFARSVEVDKDRGHYLDPDAGRVTFARYLDQYRATRTHRPATVAASASRFDKHVLPVFGNRTMASIQRSDIQGWVAKLELSPTTVETVYKELAAVFREAVHDSVLLSSPCQRIKLPRIPHGQVVPLRTVEVHQLIAAAPDRYRALLMLLAGCGLRQGEALGLTVDRVDFLRSTVTVDRQILTPATGPPVFGPPKTSASARTIPLPAAVRDELARHLARFGEGPDRLIFTNASGQPIRRSRAADAMRATVKAAGLPATVTMHDLRHYYASLLIAAGQSVKVVQARLGHRSAVETLDTYGHLWPDSEEDTMAAVDAALAGL
jgi:integrase